MSGRGHALFAVLAAPVALAQSTQVDVERFKPAATSSGLFTLEGAQTRGEEHLYYSGYLHYARNPLLIVNRDTDEVEAHIVTGQLGLDLVAAWTFLPWLEVGAALPVSAFMTGEGSAEPGDVTVAGIGDLRVVPKFVLLRDLEHGLGLACTGELRAPTHSGEYTGGPRNILFAPRLIVERSARTLGLRGLRGTVNVGAVLRERQDVTPALMVGHEFLYGAGLSLRPGRPHRAGPVELVAEINGQVGLDETDREEAPLEFLAGLRWHRPDATLEVGGGAGLIEGYGAPTWRVFAGMRFEPSPGDADHDGLLDENDRCPDVAEDMDGFQDDDGCPDLDNDGDGLPDNRDRCPGEAEDADGFQDDDGCPDPDNDGDGIPDGRDRCPTQAEDLDGFEDEDGCPDVDNDGDGVPDANDNCPTEAEDKDGFEDDDGCPDLDNDSDGVADAQDKCPTEKETINGFQDEDGCPDKGLAQVVVTHQELEIRQKVFFATNSDVIKRRSFGLLNQVALHLKANPQLRRVRVEGHTDSRGSRTYNVALSQRRAESVVSYLIGRGVAPERLTALGLGPDRPIASNKTARGRAANRRVAFVIVESTAPAVAPKLP